MIYISVVSEDSLNNKHQQQWVGEYKASFLQQLTARTGSPLSPRALWELLVGAVAAAEADTAAAAAAAADGRPREIEHEHAAAAGVFLNLWR